jgi:predicted ATP-dependent protease
MTNLDPLQKTILKQLQENKNIIIKPRDQNLGLAVQDRETYIKQILQEHLTTKTYQQLSPVEAKTC